MARLAVSPRLTRTIAISYAALWAVTLAVAFIVASLGELGHTVRGLYKIEFAGSGLWQEPWAPARLWWRNFGVCSWPLLVGIVAAPTGFAASAARVAVGASVALNVGFVGAALGGYGGALLPYLPQLPLEWLALAAGAAPWLSRRNPERRELLALALLVAVTLAIAALLEVYATPRS